MKFQSVMLLLLSIFFFVSCEKEYSVENGGIPDGTSGGTATYTLDGGSGNCTGAVTSGTYIQGTATGSGNIVLLQVTVDSTGTYNISTNSVNGVSFSGSGTFTATGAQTITLSATGTPTTTGSFNYTVGSNGCTFSVTVEVGGEGTALFTFSGDTGECTGATSEGEFVKGKLLTAASTVNLSVNVISVGTYNISTPTINGFNFSGTGTFTATGAQNITLTANGTPSATGISTFTTGSGGCSFSIIVTEPGTTPPAYSGQFTATLNGTVTTFNVVQASLIRDASLNGKRFDLAGVSLDGQLRLIISLADYSSSSGNDIRTGDYTIRLLQDDDPLTTDDESIDSDDGIFTMSELIAQNSWFTDVYKMTGLVKISSISPGFPTGKITGTFSGVLKEYTSGNAKYTFTNGVFNDITYYILN